VAVIKSKLESFGIMAQRKDIKKMRKAELIDLLLSEMENSCNSRSTSEMACTQEHVAAIKTALKEPCTILVLDEHLLRFPFESMGMLSDITVTRVPSLPFVLATLLETESLHSVATPKVDASRVNYVLDPESNLSESASTLGPALNSIASKNGLVWEQVVGQMPSSEFMFQALLEENGLYLYCGHGGGEKAFSHSQVEGLMTIRDDGTRGCRASVVLMGCSSGKLQSVNGRVRTMHYEPEGIALTYLLSGAPCVVGNLWDVTDRDIDR
jgi:separase